MVPALRSLVVRAGRESMKELERLISEDKPARILFDHLPKCGGQTLTAYLKAHYPLRKIFRTNGVAPAASATRFKALPQQKRHAYELVVGHLANELIDWIHPDSVITTVLRDPVERIVSHYFYARKTPVHYLHQRIHAEAISLDQYATRADLSDELQNWYTAHFSGLSADAVRRDPDAALAKAVETVLTRYDVVGFLDDFAAFVKTLRHRADLKREYLGEKVNVTRRPAAEAIAPSTISLIEQMNSLDVALYAEIRRAHGRAMATG